MSVTASEARKQLFPLIEKVNNDRVAVMITSRRGNAVLISAEEFAALEETAYLLRGPANASDFSRASNRRGLAIDTSTTSLNEARLYAERLGRPGQLVLSVAWWTGYVSKGPDNGRRLAARSTLTVGLRCSSSRTPADNRT